MANLYSSTTIATGVVLATGTYTAGQILTAVAGADWSFATPTGAINEEVGVLLEDVDTATDGIAGVVAVGSFNESKLQINGGVVIDFKGLLQSRGINASIFNK